MHVIQRLLFLPLAPNMAFTLKARTAPTFQTSACNFEVVMLIVRARAHKVNCAPHYLTVALEASCFSAAPFPKQVSIPVHSKASRSGRPDSPLFPRTPRRILISHLKVVAFRSMALEHEPPQPTASAPVLEPAQKLAKVDISSTLRVKKLSERAVLPTRGSQHAAGYDLSR